MLYHNLVTLQNELMVFEEKGKSSKHCSIPGGGEKKGKRIEGSCSKRFLQTSKVGVR